jgi:MFS superfamily sulfate permease-like transporter
MPPAEVDTMNEARQDENETLLDQDKPASHDNVQHSRESDHRSSKPSFLRRTLVKSKTFLPILTWLPEYRRAWFPGDFIGALTVASLYVPLSISFALLAHAHPITGLCSFLINPLLYALLGTCPLMVVGPEAPGSLLVGNYVALFNSDGDGDEAANAKIASAVTVLTGTILFLAGLTRVGYIDSILSRPFMRGFIGAVGLNVLIVQAISGLGLSKLAKEDSDGANGSAARKLIFVLSNLHNTHGLTSAISLSAFTLIMVSRYVRIDIPGHNDSSNSPAN